MFGSLILGTGVNSALLMIERVREGVALHRRDTKLRNCRALEIVVLITYIKLLYFNHHHHHFLISYSQPLFNLK